MFQCSMVLIRRGSRSSQFFWFVLLSFLNRCIDLLYSLLEILQFFRLQGWDCGDNSITSSNRSYFFYNQLLIRSMCIFLQVYQIIKSPDSYNSNHNLDKINGPVCEIYNIYLLQIFFQLPYFNKHILISQQLKHMVILGFVFMARCQNVQEVFMPQEGDWHAVIKCSNCHQNFPKQVTFNKHQTVEMTKQHGTAHFGATCKNCDSKCYISIDEGSKYRAQPNEDGVIKETILKVDCRRCDIVKVNLGNSMTVKCSKSGTTFQNADFTDLWCEMDQETDLLVQVEDPRIQVIVINDKK